MTLLDGALAVIGGVVGLMSGLLGTGGAILFIPLALLVPPVLGLDTLPVHTVAGLSAVQVVTAATVGGLSHSELGTSTARCW